MDESRIVFIVDDDRSVRESLTALVMAHGFEARAYESAERFLESGDHRLPGCVVADMRMDGMSGIELSAKMRREGITTPVIVISAYLDSSLTEENAEGDAPILLEKSCSGNQFWATVTQVLGTTQA